MRRVYIIYALRKINEPIFVKSVVFAVLLLVFMLNVSVPNVFANILNSAKTLSNAFYFFVSAFSSSLLLVKLVIIAEALVGLALVRDIAKRVLSGDLSTSVDNVSAA